MRSTKGIYKTIYLEKEILAKVLNVAEREGRSINNVFNRLLAEALKKK